MPQIHFSNSLYDSLREIAHESKVASVLQSQHFTSNELGNYLSYSQGKISYLPQSIPVMDEEDQYDSPKRVNGRAARMVRNFIRPDVLDLELTDQDFEIFANKIKATDLTEMLEFTLVSGDDIKKYYNANTNASRNTGTLASSCMRYDECGAYMGLYVSNPDKIKMIIAKHKETEKLYGRALVWYPDNGDIVLDRVYGNDAMIETIKIHAKAQGWWTRYRNTYEAERSYVNPQGKRSEQSWKVSLDSSTFTKYPYMDTFKYLNKTEGWISNDYDSNYAHILTSTRGEAISRRG